MKKLLVFLCLAALLLTGCAGKKTPAQNSPSRPEQPANPTDATQEPVAIDPAWEFLLEEPTGPEATKVVLELSSQSLTESLEYYFLRNSNPGGVAYLDTIAQKRSFTVDSFSREGEVVTAQLTVTVPDAYAALKTADLSACETAEETDAALGSAIEAAQLKTYQVSLRFTEGSNCWEPMLDEAAADAFYGGLMTYLQETMEGGE